MTGTPPVAKSLALVIVGLLLFVTANTSFNPTQAAPANINAPAATPTHTTPSITPTPCLSANVVQNPGFETGTFAPWVISDTNPSPVVTTTQQHSGTYSALLGTIYGPEPNGDGSIYQTVTVPAGGGMLSFWYWPFSKTDVDFDWQDAYVENTSGTILAIIMHIWSQDEMWEYRTFDMTPYAGQTVRIVFLVHEDGFGDDTAMYVDDVTIQAPIPCNTPTGTATPAGPTNTPLPLTNTPAPATNTPLPSVTSTPAPPTDTPAPVTNTPLPTITSTPAPPTNTPSPTNTSAPAPSITPSPCPNPFVDIDGNVFYGAIHYLSCHGIVNGTDATHYSPAGTSTRGQFAKVVVLGFGTPSYTPASPDFTDVLPGYFAYLYIETGFHAGILSGFDQANCTSHGATYPCYLPNILITRGQLTKLVVNAAHYPLYTPTGGQQTFTDVPPSNVFFVSIETAVHKGVVNGYPDQTYRPNNNIRRDEMAQIVYKGVTTP